MESPVNFNKNKIILCILILIFTLHQNVLGYSEYTITDYEQYKGKIFDADTKDPLASVHIYIEDTNINTVTNKDGEFLLKVPVEFLSKNIIVRFLGYNNKVLPIAGLQKTKNKIYLSLNSIKLAEIDINTLKDCKSLVKAVFKKKGDNYLDTHSLMTAFYRETIKKRSKNLSLSEAIVNIYKTPYSSVRKDILEFYKIRKNTNYTKKDTLAFKLRGGPFNTLFMDIIKYPEYVFSEEDIDDYSFSFKGSTKINNKLIYIIQFKSKIESLLYQGELFIDYNNKILTSASYELNLSNKKIARQWFSVEKPTRSTVTPMYAKYDLKYFEKNDQWYHGYSKISLDFKVNWKRKLFNSRYNMISEMVITDWKANEDAIFPKYKERIRSSVVMTDYAVGFSDDNFWGKHNIIEPDKSIQRAIKKIQKNLN